jgi:hypothetical protein
VDVLIKTGSIFGDAYLGGSPTLILKNKIRHLDADWRINFIIGSNDIKCVDTFKRLLQVKTSTSGQRS